MSSPIGSNGDRKPGTENPDQADSMNRFGQRIQEIVEQIDELPNPAARTLMQECMESVLNFYGMGIDRMLQIVKRSGIGGQKAYQDLLNDNVIRGLLLIHDLHPTSLENRLKEALAKVRPYLQSHGGNVELLSFENDFARLSLVGSCQSCPSSAVTLELAIRQSIEDACPDLAGFEVEGIAPREDPDVGPKKEATWTEVENAARLEDGDLITVDLAGHHLVICRVNQHLYAYRDRCPECNGPLHLGVLTVSTLACRSGHRFSVLEAGRCLDQPAIHLEPFPLIGENGTVRVSVPVNVEVGAAEP
jgi:Fe-S cluster biogenesis protein NfuA/nitrite reductase/ring-hydroxylating ferredoxin subunit